MKVVIVVHHSSPSLGVETPGCEANNSPYLVSTVGTSETTVPLSVLLYGVHRDTLYLVMHIIRVPQIKSSGDLY